MALSRQKLPVLYEIRDFLDGLIADAEGTPDGNALSEPLPEPLPAVDDVLDMKKSGRVTYRLEKVSCGKGCKGCPHGPYWYAYWREGNRTRSKYIGKRLQS